MFLSPSLRNNGAFFIIGLMNNFCYVLMLTAAEDLVHGFTGVVLLCNIVPALLMKILAPFFVHYIPYNVRVLVVVLFACVSFQIVAWFDVVWVKMLGVCFGSISSGIGEVTFLAMSSFYETSTISAWSSGTGGAGIVGAFSYLLLHSWIGLTPFQTLLLVTPLPLLIFLSVFVVLTGEHAKNGFCSLPPLSAIKDSRDGRTSVVSSKRDNNRRARRDSSALEEGTLRLVRDVNNKNNRKNNHSATRVEDEDEEAVLLSASSPNSSTVSNGGGQLELETETTISPPSMTVMTPTAERVEEGSEDDIQSLTEAKVMDDYAPVTCGQKMWHLVPLLKYMIPLFFVYYSEYLINQSVAPNLKFKTGLITESNYVYYSNMYQIGVFISRSSVSVFPIKRIWVPALLQVINFVILFLDAHYRILPAIWFVFAIIFWEGLLGGSTYVNAFYRISIDVDPKYKEFSLGVASVADSIGIALSGLTSVWLQSYIHKHQSHRYI